VRKKRKFRSIIVIALLISVVGAVFYVFTSSEFERNKPVVSLVDNNGYWNMKTPLVFEMDDESGLKSYKITLNTGGTSHDLGHELFVEPKRDALISVDVPKRISEIVANEVIITVDAVDGSKWNFFSGNVRMHEFPLIIDTKRPRVGIVTNSYGIGKGGSALVVYQVADQNLRDFHIETKTGKRFKGQPFFKEGFFISLIAWPVTVDDFGATLVAEDEAGNVSKASISLYLKNVEYRTRELKLSEGYLDGKIRELAEEYPETQGVEGRIEQFKIINEDVRAANESLIEQTTSFVPAEMIDSFSIVPMYPLRNGKILGDFGDHRFYRYEGERVSESYHLGLDMASVKQARITPQNGGEVVFADENGIYGNMPIIHHGMGLYTLYGHCSTIHVQAGDRIEAGAIIANTGVTGSVLGDHLHFGVLVQGVDVRPQEWMDRQWIRLNITEVINAAKESINRLGVPAVQD